MDSFFLICSYNKTAYEPFFMWLRFILVLQLRFQVDHFVFKILFLL